jgi:hypothetical protein
MELNVAQLATAQCLRVSVLTRPTTLCALLAYNTLTTENRSLGAKSRSAVKVISNTLQHFTGHYFVHGCPPLDSSLNHVKTRQYCTFRTAVTSFPSKSTSPNRPPAFQFSATTLQALLTFSPSHFPRYFHPNNSL